MNEVWSVRPEKMKEFVSSGEDEVSDTRTTKVTDFKWKGSTGETSKDVKRDPKHFYSEVHFDWWENF